MTTCITVVLYQLWCYFHLHLSEWKLFYCM